MQVEKAEEWGRTKYRRFYRSHTHHEEVKEKGGIIVETVPAITRPDNWHTEKAFVTTTRKMKAYFWDKDFGPEIDIVADAEQSYETSNISRSEQ